MFIKQHHLHVDSQAVQREPEFSALLRQKYQTDGFSEILLVATNGVHGLLDAADREQNEITFGLDRLLWKYYIFYSVLITVQ